MFGSNLNAVEINSQWLAQLEANGTKTASASLSYIKDKLREGSFADRIVAPVDIKRGDPGVQVSLNHDTLEVVREIEPSSFGAMSLTFRGSPDAQYIRGRRFAIPFWTISSLKFEITENELMAYTMPITKMIEENTIKDMYELKDREWLSHIDACIEGMQEEGMGSAVAFSSSNVASGTVIGFSKLKGTNALARTTNDFVPLPITKDDFTNLQKLFLQEVQDASGNTIRAGRLRAATLLINEADALDQMKWTIEQTGNKMQEDSVSGGVSLNTWGGLTIVKTIKTNILREGNVYAFTSEEFGGYSYRLNDLKFYADKRGNKIEWYAWMDIGMGFGNIAWCCKLELYSGSVTPGATTSGYAVRALPEEADLRANVGINNKVAQGLTFPSFNPY